MTMQGEGKKLLSQLKEISSDMEEKLRQIDERLSHLENSIKASGETGTQIWLDDIREIRGMLILVKKEDEDEIADEKILMDMITKLNELIEETIGQ